MNDTYRETYNNLKERKGCLVKRNDMVFELQRIGYTKLGSRKLINDFIKWGKNKKLIENTKERGIYRLCK